VGRQFRVPHGMTTPTKTGSVWQSKVSMPTDEEGFFGRQCPAEDCRAFFKLEAAEYSAAPDNLRLSCPVCGLTDDHKAFITQDQARRAEAAIHEMAQGAIRAALDDAFSGLSGHSGGLVSITYKPGPAYTPKPLPTYIEQQTIRTFICPAGGHRAVIYDLLAMCPYCGPATPPRAVLDDNLAAMARLLDVIEQLPAEHRREVEAIGGISALSERALTGAVAVLQNFAKQLHGRAGKAAVAGNPWQNVDRLRKQWQEDFSVDPMARLSASDLAALRLGFARRHVLEHNNGVADAKYVAESGDTLVAGRRVRFRSPFVRNFIAASLRLADALEGAISGGADGLDAGAEFAHSTDDGLPGPISAEDEPLHRSQEVSMTGIGGKSAKRSAYLRALYAKSAGRPLHIDLGMDTATSVGIVDEAELVSIARYLENEGLVEIRTTGPGISITHRGAQVVEESFDPESDEGRQAEARQQDRNAFMRQAYELVDGDDMKLFNFRDVASALGWEEDRSLIAAEYLDNEGYVSWYTMGGNLVLTHQGIKLVESGR